MSHYKPYPTYKDSGVEWLGQVPEHWEIMSVKTIATIDGGAGFPEDEQGYLDRPIPFYKVSNLINNMSSVEHTITEETAKQLGAHVFSAGTLVFAKVGAALFLNRRSLLSQPACIDNNMMAIIPRRCEPKWLFWVFNCIDMGLIANPGAVPSVNQEQVGNIKLGFPSTYEQKVIVAYLDRTTARIDALVNAKTRFIELLREKRQALITHAVTKGLDPNVKMKHSGVEWLGQVPEHWQVRKLVQLTTKIGDGLHGTPQYVENSDYFFINGNNLANGFIVISEGTKCISYEELIQNQVDLNEQTLLMSINGTIGNVAFYRGEPVMLGKSAAYINCSQMLSRELLFFLLQSTFIKTFFDLEITGTTILNLSLQTIRNTPIPLPPIGEQVQIGAYLGLKTARIDALITKTERSIELLKERRSALITAAVTGQIDLREVEK